MEVKFCSETHNGIPTSLTWKTNPCSKPVDLIEFKTLIYGHGTRFSNLSNYFSDLDLYSRIVTFDYGRRILFLKPCISNYLFTFIRSCRVSESSSVPFCIVVLHYLRLKKNGCRIPCSDLFGFPLIYL